MITAISISSDSGFWVDAAALVVVLVAFAIGSTRWGRAKLDALADRLGRWLDDEGTDR